MICKCCGKEVILKTREQKNMDFYCRYCSDKHQKKYASPKYINTCITCGTKFETGNAKKKYCSAKCRYLNFKNKQLYKKICQYCGKEFETKYKNTQYCTSECGSRHYAERTKKHYYCEYCGKERFSDHPSRHRFCSVECALASKRNNVDVTEKNKIELIKICPICKNEFKPINSRHIYCSRKCLDKAISIKGKKLWGEQYKARCFKCLICGKEVTTKVGYRRKLYCSDECLKKATKRKEKEKRAAEMKKSFVEPVSMKFVYNRDKGICGICGYPVINDSSPENIWGATIDHIIPLSKGGLHQKSNCQLAHRLCNSMKCDSEEYHISWEEKLKLEPEKWGGRLNELYKQIS